VEQRFGGLVDSFGARLREDTPPGVVRDVISGLEDDPVTLRRLGRPLVAEQAPTALRVVIRQRSSGSDSGATGVKPFALEEDADAPCVVQAKTPLQPERGSPAHGERTRLWPTPSPRKRVRV